MEMAEALFGDEDKGAAAGGATPEGSVDSSAFAAIAAHLERGGALAKKVDSANEEELANKDASAAKPKLGAPMDLAAAREEGLRTATAPQHYVDAVKRQKIASGTAKKVKELGADAGAEVAPKAVAATASAKVAKSAKATSKKDVEAPAAAKAAKAAPAAGRDEDETRAGGVTHLGSQGTQYPTDYDPSVLETFENKHPDNDYFVKFNCPEFTSLCPITGQPDFATIYISYVPGERMVESKSLKLYLFSFRNHGDFHEDCMNIIMKDLIELMDPKYIEVWGKFTPRGGISIDPYCNYGRPGTPWEKVAWERLTQHDMYPEKVDNR